VRVTFNRSSDDEIESQKWAELQEQLDKARERLLRVSAGNCVRDCPRVQWSTGAVALACTAPLRCHRVLRSRACNPARLVPRQPVTRKTLQTAR
jgi:hypothetical protein